MALTLILFCFQSLLFLRPSKNGKGGTLSGKKLDIYILLKILNLVHDAKIKSFILKFCVEMTLGEEKYEKADIGSSLQRVRRFHELRGKFVGVNPKLAEIGVKRIGLNYDEELFGFIFEDINHEDKSGTTALSQATRAGDLSEVQDCIDMGADVNKCDKNGRSPLHLASNEGYFFVVQKLGKGIKNKNEN